MAQTLKLEVLRELVITWRKCREHYPGWVIAPADARETLWQYTEQWLEILPSNLPRMKPDEALFLTAEAFWRIDTALSPMLLSQAEMATEVLSRINPAPDVLPWPVDAEVLDTAKGVRSELTAAWVSTSFAVMREAREDFDTGRYEMWRDRLQRIARERPDWLARWHYEQSLTTLWRLDFDGLDRALNDWPVQTAQLPFWEIKRAALWAELGDIQRAQSTAESALDTIRARTRVGAVDYQNLSEEGWAMRLVMALRHSRARFMPESERARFQERFSELARYKCNPWEVTEWLELALSAPRPTLRPVETESITFDPGTYSTRFSHKRQTLIETARPAFAFLRVVEEAAVPLRVGSLMMLSSELKQIPLWIAPFAFSWAVATAIRSDEEEVVEELLNRTNIGILKQSHALTLADWLSEVCERSLNRLTQETDHGWERPLPQRIVGAVAEALSRLILRVDASKVERIVALAEDMCRIKAASPLFGEMKHIDAIFRRAIESCLSPEQIERRIVDWLELPLPSEIGGPPVIHQERAEPFHYITINKTLRWKRPLGASVNDRIQKLLHAVAFGTAWDRRRASIRLVVVAQLGGLMKREILKLKEALWERLDPGTKLPIETGVRLTFLMKYCPFPKKERRGILQRAFLETPIPRIRIPSADGSGFALDSVGAERHVTNLSDITGGLWTPADARHYTVSWTPKESSTLLSHIREWWENERSTFSASAAQKSFVLDPIKSCTEILVDLLGSALIPQLPHSNAEAVLSLVESIGSHNVPTLPAKPAAVRLGLRRDQLVQETLACLLSTNSPNVRSACRAIQNWLMLAKSVSWTPNPARIVEAVVWKIVLRRKPGLDTLMNLTASLLDRRAILISFTQVNDLALGLEFLVEETELPQELSQSLLTRPEDDSLGYPDRPHHRLAAARLARALGRHLKRSKRAVPKIIENWRDLSDASTLPELRKVWRAGRESDY